MTPHIWIEESCRAQDATEPKDYIGMAMAYSYAAVCFGLETPLTSNFILVLFDLVKQLPAEVPVEYRKTPVTFVDGGYSVAPKHVERQVKLLIDAIGEITPEEFYQRFEEIHPFTDGNGRVGAILYNYLKETLEDPIHPPEFVKL